MSDNLVAALAIGLSVVVFGLLITGVVLMVRDTIRKKGNWGINLSPPACRSCGEPRAGHPQAGEHAADLMGRLDVPGVWPGTGQVGRTRRRPAFPRQVVRPTGRSRRATPHRPTAANQEET